MSATNASLRDAYLARLGVEQEPPSVDALFRVHRAHVERVAYETLWIHLGQRWSADASESMTRVATQRRGGYCFHLNGAASELLRALGYDVRRHVGGVHGPDGATAAEMTNHLVLTVHGLPNEANPSGIWYFDVGLGDALHEPLPLMPGHYQQGPFHLELETTTNPLADWHLIHDKTGWFAEMSWRSEATDLDAFAARHAFLSTSPESGFVKLLVAGRRDATGVDLLRGLTLRRVGRGATERTLTTQAELTDVLGDVFGLDTTTMTGEAGAALWMKVHTAHEAWEAAGRP
jgi:N-hydroxyarylamine O-acetyltransferase